MRSLHLADVLHISSLNCPIQSFICPLRILQDNGWMVVNLVATLYRLWTVAHDLVVGKTLGSPIVVEYSKKNYSSTPSYTTYCLPKSPHLGFLSTLCILCCKPIFKDWQFTTIPKLKYSANCQNGWWGFKKRTEICLASWDQCTLLMPWLKTFRVAFHCFYAFFLYSNSGCVLKNRRPF